MPNWRQRLTANIEANLKSIWKLIKYVFGFYEGDMFEGSKIRRFLGRITGLLILVFSIEAFTPLFTFPELNTLSLGIGVLWSFAYFLLVVIIPILFLADRTFVLEPRRLIADIMISAAYSIMVFGLLYRNLGFLPSADGMSVRHSGDAYYLSTVTFSTLGFGDFRPEMSARGYAALQGIWGNVHLGIFAGAVFYAITINQQKSAKDGH